MGISRLPFLRKYQISTVSRELSLMGVPRNFFVGGMGLRIVPREYLVGGLTNDDVNGNRNDTTTQRTT